MNTLFRFLSVASHSGNLRSSKVERWVSQRGLKYPPPWFVKWGCIFLHWALERSSDPLHRLVRKGELTLLFVPRCLCSVFLCGRTLEVFRAQSNHRWELQAEADALLRHRSSCRERQRSCGFLGEWSAGFCCGRCSEHPSWTIRHNLIGF